MLVEVEAARCGGCREKQELKQGRGKYRDRRERIAGGGREREWES